MAGLGGIVPMLGLGGLAQGYGQGMQYGREIGQMQNEMAYRNAMLNYRQGSLQERQQAQMATVQNALDNAIARGIGPYGGPDAYKMAARTYDNYARQYGLQPGSYLNIYGMMTGGANATGGYAADPNASDPGAGGPSAGGPSPTVGQAGPVGQVGAVGQAGPVGQVGPVGQGGQVGQLGPVGQAGSANGYPPTAQMPAGVYSQPSSQPVGVNLPTGASGSPMATAPNAAATNAASGSDAMFGPSGSAPVSATANPTGGATAGTAAATYASGGWQTDPFIVGSGGYQDQLAGYQAQITALRQHMAGNPYADHSDDMARMASVSDRAGQLTNEMSDYVSRNYTGPDAWKAHWTPYQDALDSFDRGGMTGAELQYRIALLNRQSGGLGITLPTRDFNFGMTDPKAIAGQWQKIDAAYQNRMPMVSVGGKNVPTSTFVGADGSHNSVLDIAMSPAASADIAVKASQQHETDARAGSQAAQDEARIRQMQPGPDQARASLEHRQRFPFDTGFQMPATAGSTSGQVNVPPIGNGVNGGGMGAANIGPAVRGVSGPLPSGSVAPPGQGGGLPGSGGSPVRQIPIPRPWLWNSGNVLGQATTPASGQQAGNVVLGPGPVRQAGSGLPANWASISKTGWPGAVPGLVGATGQMSDEVYRVPKNGAPGGQLSDTVFRYGQPGSNPQVVELANRLPNGVNGQAVKPAGRNAVGGSPVGRNGIVLASNTHPGQGVGGQSAFGSGGPFGSVWSPSNVGSNQTYGATSAPQLTKAQPYDNNGLIVRAPRASQRQQAPGGGVASGAKGAARTQTSLLHPGDVPGTPLANDAVTHNGYDSNNRYTIPGYGTVVRYSDGYVASYNATTGQRITPHLYLGDVPGTPMANDELNHGSYLQGNRRTIPGVGTVVQFNDGTTGHYNVNGGRTSLSQSNPNQSRQARVPSASTPRSDASTNVKSQADLARLQSFLRTAVPQYVPGKIRGQVMAGKPTTAPNIPSTSEPNAFEDFESSLTPPSDYKPSQHNVFDNFSANSLNAIGGVTDAIATPQGRAEVSRGVQRTGQQLADAGSFAREAVTAPFGLGRGTFNQPQDRARNARAASFYDSFYGIVLGSQGGPDAAPFDILRAANAAQAGDKATAMRILRNIPGHVGQWAHDNPDIVLQDLAPVLHGVAAHLIPEPTMGPGRFPGDRASLDQQAARNAYVTKAMDAQRAQHTLTVGDNGGPSATPTARSDMRLGSTSSGRPTASPPLVNRQANMTAPAKAGAVSIGELRGAVDDSSRIATSAATRSAVPGTQGMNNASLTHADSLYNTRTFNGYDYSNGNNVKEPLPLKVEDMSSETPVLGGRQAGINRAWRLEVQLVQRFGRGTRPWTTDEIGRIHAGDSYTDLGYTGHHSNAVRYYNDWKGDPRNIYFLRQGSGEEHMGLGHPGGTQVPQPQMPLINRQWMLDNLDPDQLS